VCSRRAARSWFHRVNSIPRCVSESARIKGRVPSVKIIVITEEAYLLSFYHSLSLSPLPLASLLREHPSLAVNPNLAPLAAVLKTALNARACVRVGIEFRFQCSIACTLPDIPNLAARVSRESLVIYCHPVRLLLPFSLFLSLSLSLSLFLCLSLSLSLSLVHVQDRPDNGYSTEKPRKEDGSWKRLSEKSCFLFSTDVKLSLT